MPSHSASWWRCEQRPAARPGGLLNLPEPISWWPPAPGWWLLASLTVAALAALLLWRRERRLSLSSGRLASRELARLRAAWRADGDDAALLRELSRLLRRFVLARFPGDQAAALCGESWLRYLADKSGDERFLDGVGRCLAEAPYRAPDRVSAWLDVAGVAGLVERFIAQPAGNRVLVLLRPATPMPAGICRCCCSGSPGCCWWWRWPGPSPSATWSRPASARLPAPIVHLLRIPSLLGTAMRRPPQPRPEGSVRR